MAVPYLRKYRIALILVGTFALILIGGKWWQEIRTRPTRQLYRTLDRSGVTVRNISRQMRYYRFPQFIRRLIPESDELSDTVSLTFRTVSITSEKIELCCRFQSIHDLAFSGPMFDAGLLKPFLAHPEIKGLSFWGQAVTDEQLFKILDDFPKLQWIDLTKTAVTDKTVDVLVARKITLVTPPRVISFSPAAISKLRAAKLAQ
ncbi:MAG: hypothetical protein U0903_11575 [Planctomycetales bacterium]